MNNNKKESKEPHDEIIEELWKIKDNFSQSCSSSFLQLVNNVKKDVEHIQYKLVRDKTIQKVAWKKQPDNSIVLILGQNY